MHDVPVRVGRGVPLVLPCLAHVVVDDDVDGPAGGIPVRARERDLLARVVVREVARDRRRRAATQSGRDREQNRSDEKKKDACGARASQPSCRALAWCARTTLNNCAPDSHLPALPPSFTPLSRNRRVPRSKAMSRRARPPEDICGRRG